MIHSFIIDRFLVGQGFWLLGKTSNKNKNKFVLHHGGCKLRYAHLLQTKKRIHYARHNSKSSSLPTQNGIYIIEISQANNQLTKQKA